MRRNWSRAPCVALAAFGVLGFSGAASAADTMITGNVPMAASSSTTTSFFAPLWVYPTTQGAPPIMVAPSAG